MAISSRTGASLATDRPSTFRRTASAALAALLIAVLLCVFAVSTYHRTSRSDVKSYDLWAIFHYYLGAKYFSELGYFDLYSCALESDRETAGVWNGLEAARDMRSYRIVAPSRLPPCPRANFTAGRWSDFSRDVEYFARHAQPEYFEGVFTDKGFNPPPSWVFVAKPLAEAVPVGDGILADVVFNLDVAAVLLGICLIWRADGGIAALLTAALAVFYFGTFGHIGGNFLQYLWFPFLVGAAILWRQKRPAFSGAMLGIAAGLQIFPLLFGLPIVARGAIDLVRGKGAINRTREAKAAPSRPYFRPYLRFSCALIVTLLASFLLGSLARRGPGAWNQWRQKISIHSNYLRGEIFNIGLGNLTATLVSNSRQDGDSYVDDVPNTFARIDALKNHISVYYVAAGAVLALWLAAVAAAPEDDLFGHGFLILYALLNLSPYYYLSLVLLPFFFWQSSRALRLYAIGASVALVIVHAILFPRLNVFTFVYWPHLIAACAIAIAMLSLAAMSIFSYSSGARQNPSEESASR